MTDLRAWLSAIWDEDEAALLPHLSGARRNGKNTTRRMLAQIAAARQILLVHDVAWNAEVCTVCHHLTGRDLHVDNDPWPCVTVRLLALPYANRPGYSAALSNGRA